MAYFLVAWREINQNGVPAVIPFAAGQVHAMVDATVTRTTLHRRLPWLDIDLCSRATLHQPQQTYRAIRQAGPVVWLPRHRLWAIGRFADVLAALRDDELYRSGDGVVLNSLLNRPLRKTTLPATATSTPSAAGC